MQEDLIDFPCDYPVKAMGHSSDDFEAHVVSLVSQHATLSDPKQITTKASSGGRYTSVTVSVRARSREHLELIYADLKSDDRVVYTL